MPKTIFFTGASTGFGRDTVAEASLVSLTVNHGPSTSTRKEL